MVKISRDGSQLLYGTYIGGPSGELPHRFFTIERVLGLDVDSDGRVYAAGQTDSHSFPTTPDAWDGTYNGGPRDAIAFGLEKDGSALLFSTYLGGSHRDRADGVTVDRGHFLIAAQTISPDFPTTAGAFQPADPDPRPGSVGQDALLLELGKRGDLRYSTYFGGTGLDAAFGVAVHDDASAWVAGWTDSNDLPTTAGAAQAVDPDPSPTAGRDAFVARLRTSPEDTGG